MDLTAQTIGNGIDLGGWDGFVLDYSNAMLDVLSLSVGTVRFQC